MIAVWEVGQTCTDTRTGPTGQCPCGGLEKRRLESWGVRSKQGSRREGASAVCAELCAGRGCTWARTGAAEGEREGVGWGCRRETWWEFVLTEDLPLISVHPAKRKVLKDGEGRVGVGCGWRPRAGRQRPQLTQQGTRGAREGRAGALDSVFLNSCQ